MIQSRKEAIAAGSRYYTTNKPCKNGHLSKRFVYNGACYECGQKASRKFWESKRYSDLDFRKKRIFDQVKNRAKRQGIEFDIRFEDLVWPEYCPVLGIELNYLNHTDNKNQSSPSFDRVNPNKGYVKDNVRIISLRVNRIKFNASLEEIELVLKYIKGEL